MKAVFIRTINLFADLAAGGSDDWAKGVAGVRFSYTVELGDTGRYGFVLPVEYIDPTGKQMFQAARTLALDVVKRRQDDQRLRQAGQQANPLPILTYGHPQQEEIDSEVETEELSASSG